MFLSLMMQLPAVTAVKAVPEVTVQLALLLANVTVPLPEPPLLLKVAVWPMLKAVNVDSALSVAWLALLIVIAWLTVGAAPKLALPA